MAAKKFKPKEIAAKKIEDFKKDTFAIMWVILIATIMVMTFLYKTHVRDMIVISFLFVIFWYFESLMISATGTTISTFLAHGKKVPKWKRFPLFFIVIMLLYVIYAVLQRAMEIAFPSGSVNIVIVVLWLGFMYLIWTFKFSSNKRPAID